MNRARAWVLIVAGTCFGAGVAVGLVAPDLVEAVSAEQEQDPEEDYVQYLVEQLELSSEQVQTVRIVLAARKRDELEHINGFGFTNLPRELQTLLSGAREIADRRIRVILDEEQRKKYQDLLDAQKALEKTGKER